MVGYAQQMPPLMSDIRPSVERVLQEVTQQTDPNEVMTFLQSSPFLADTNDFSTLPFSGLRRNSVYAQFIHQLVLGPDARHADMRAALVRRLQGGPDTLGAQLFIAHLSEDRAQAVYRVLASARPAIETRDEAWRRDLAFMVTDSLGTIAADKRQAWTHENRQAYAWLTELREGGDRSDVAMLMNAKSFQSLQIEEREFARHVAEMIESVSASDPARAKAVLLKAVDLVERAAKKGQWRYTPASEFVDSVFQRGPRSLALLVLAVDLIRDVNSPLPPLGSTSHLRHNRAVSELYQEVGDPNDPDPFKQTQRLYERLGKRFGQGNFSGVLYCFKWPFESDLTAQELNAIRSWAEAESSTGTYPGIAREFLTLARIATPVDSDKPKKGANLLEPILLQYSEVLADESLSVRWRLLTLRQLFKRGEMQGPKLWNDAMILQGMALLTRGWKNETSLPQDYLGRLLVRAARLPDTPAWRKQVAEVTEAYNAYLRRRARTTRSISRSPYPTHPRTYSQSVQLSLLEMKLRVGDKDSVQKLIVEASNATDLDAWAILVEHGELERARKLMRRGWQEVDRSSDHPYTAAFETNLTACLAEITEPDLRYYGELLLSALADGPAEDPPGRTREQRLVELAERFAEVSFRNEGVKQRALLVLGGSDQALAQVGDALAVAAQGIDLGAVCSLSLESEREVKSSLVLAYAAEALKR
ncbi:MAG: hypothetical protein IIA65_10340, partial [Planctomycetes bacterium]|nr:hypothetical protein [Planctomycetota bacterium]